VSLFLRLKDMRKTGYRGQGIGYSKKFTAVPAPKESSTTAELSGFTLVELLVVISIIAMLMGILMPALNAARRNSYKSGCKQNLHGIGIAFRMYLDDNGNKMPAAMYFPSVAMPEETDNNIKPISEVLAKYLGGPEALKCPADRWPEKNSTYFKENGSSYQYNNSLAGMRLDQKVITFIRRRHWGGEVRTVTRPISEVEVMFDYSGFHGKPKSDGTYDVGAFMYLYADTLVADRERNPK
jgi:prepilin-type N-terminal cleavage/methylation domain-containing protein